MALASWDYENYNCRIYYYEQEGHEVDAAEVDVAEVDVAEVDYDEDLCSSAVELEDSVFVS